MKKLKAGIIYPELLGTYGDKGNALTFAFRARQRNLEVEIIEISPNDNLPTSLDIYFLGGGEDKAQTLATDLLRKELSALKEIISTSLLIGICAGFQILGSAFPVTKTQIYEGLDLIDVTTTSGGERIIGELVTQCSIEPIGYITGFENHGGRTLISNQSQAAGNVIKGIGNSEDSMIDGYIDENIFCSYAHGPLFARNPLLCDYFLAKTLGIEINELNTIESDFSKKLHEERLKSMQIT